ncbi:MAG: ankyrin repeat domain-containing protein [Cyanobacteria bacterium J06649_11]
MLNFDADIFDAAEVGDIETVERFWSESIDVDYQDLAGRTLLMYAASNGHIDVFNFLFKHNADASLKDKMGETALDKALNASTRDLLIRYRWKI